MSGPTLSALCSDDKNIGKGERLRTRCRFGALRWAVVLASFLLGPMVAVGRVAAQDPPPPDVPDSAACLPAATGASVPQETAHGFRPSDPVPPRMLYGGFLESTGHTLPRGRGYAGVGYMGADWLAQIGTNVWDALRPYVVYGAFGVTDDLTVGTGIGLIYGFSRATDPDGQDDFWCRRGRGGSSATCFERLPHVTAKFRVVSTDRSSLAVGAFWGVFSWANFGGFNSVLYGLSASYSWSFADLVALNGSIGMHGRSIDRGIQINHEAEDWSAMAIGAEVRVLPQFRLVSELRSFGGFDPDEGKRTEVLSAALRYLGGAVGVEVGVSRWLVPQRLWLGATRPVLSVAYSF